MQGPFQKNMSTRFRKLLRGIGSSGQREKPSFEGRAQPRAAKICSRLTTAGRGSRAGAAAPLSKPPPPPPYPIPPRNPNPTLESFLRCPAVPPPVDRHPRHPQHPGGHSPRSITWDTWLNWVLLGMGVGFKGSAFKAWFQGTRIQKPPALWFLTHLPLCLLLQTLDKFWRTLGNNCQSVRTWIKGTSRYVSWKVRLLKIHLHKLGTILLV